MTKRKDGLFQEKIKIGDKLYYFYGHSKKEVLEKIRNFQEKKERGKLFGETADQWWLEHCEKIAYSTIRGYKASYLRAKNYFDTVPVKDITALQINEILTEFAKTKSEKTVKTQFSVYDMIFRFAVSRGYITFNPIRDLPIPHGLKATKRNMPSSEDIDKIKKSVNTEFGLFAYMALYTGLRRGELLALKWEDININDRTITVNKSLYFSEDNKPHIKRPKTDKSNGSVPILNTLLPYMKKKKGIVFCDENGNYLKEYQFAKKWNAYCKKADLHITPHQLRHAYATMLFEANIPPEQMQLLLRHAQLSTTMDIYKEFRSLKQKEIFESIYAVDF